MVDTPTLLISTALKIVFVLIIILTFAPILIWAERRQSAMIQDRVGPHRAGVKLFGKNITLLGLLHPLADALKLIWKEDFVPPRADKLLHAMAPIVGLVPAIATFAVIPFGDVLYLDHLWDFLVETADGRYCFAQSSSALDVCTHALGQAIPLQVAPLNVGILFIFAVAGTGVVGAAIAGYASDNKYSLLGGMRAAGQMVSYEVVLGLSLVGCFMIYGTVRLEEMVRWQIHHQWGVVVQPLAAVLYFAAAIAETKRIPFDVPEGESEIVGGYFTEYSGMKFGMFFMGEFIEVVVLAAIATCLFLGGWDAPFLTSTGLEVVWRGNVVWSYAIPHVAVVVLQVLTFILKLIALMWLQLMVRWTLPRFRFDQIMSLCWKYLLPTALANIVVTGAVLLMLEN